MSNFPFDEHTVLIQILDAYPWLSEVLPAMDRRLSVMNTPMGRMMMKRSTVADLARLSGYSSEKLLARLRREVESREGADLNKF